MQHWLNLGQYALPLPDIHLKMKMVRTEVLTLCQEYFQVG
jgi:hypothetical protein